MVISFQPDTTLTFGNQQSQANERHDSRYPDYWHGTASRMGAVEGYGQLVKGPEGTMTTDLQKLVEEALPCTCSGDYVTIGRMIVDHVNETERFERHTGEPNPHSSECAASNRPAILALLERVRGETLEDAAKIIEGCGGLVFISGKTGRSAAATAIRTLASKGRKSDDE